MAHRLQEIAMDRFLAHLICRALEVGVAFGVLHLATRLALSVG